MIDHQADRLDVAVDSGVLERAGVHPFVGNLRCQEIDAFRAFCCYGHREADLSDGFRVRSALDQQLDDPGIAGCDRFEQR